MTGCLRLLMGLMLMAGGCRFGDESRATAGTASRPQSGTSDADLAVVGTEYAFELPAEVRGGVLTMSFRNRGELRHEAAIVAVGDAPLDQVVADLGPVLEGGVASIPDYLTFYGGAGEVAPGTTSRATLRLPEGTYVMFCSLTDIDSVDALPQPGPALPPHYRTGMARAFTVEGDNVDTLPPSDGILTATDYAFDLPEITAGRKTFLFRNAGDEMHLAAFLVFPEGVGRAGARRTLDAALSGSGGALPEGVPEPSDAAQAGPYPPRAGGTFGIDFEAGRTYAVVCVLPDRAGGPPHASRGMLEIFTVPTPRGS